jgi:hypothetical protein
LLCTYQALNVNYYQYSVFGLNVILVSILSPLLLVLCCVVLCCAHVCVCVCVRARERERARVRVSALSVWPWIFM